MQLLLSPCPHFLEDVVAYTILVQHGVNRGRGGGDEKKVATVIRVYMPA